MWETPSYTLIVLICLMKAGEIRAQCVRPIIGENRILTETSRQDNFPDGSTLTYKCSTGYVPEQPGSSNSITCKGTQWTELQLQCKLKSCGNPGEIPHGKYLTPDGILFGATITAQCDEGYMLVGEGTRNCQAEGWDGRAPVCEVVKCKPPPSIQNGNFDPMDEVYNYNQAVTYSCEKDYFLIGESTISCSDNGSFPPPPRCLKISCDAPTIENAVRTGEISCDAPTIENAVRTGGKSPPYKYKEFVEYKCNKGYKMEGSRSLTCEENGWHPSPPLCIEDKIGPGPIPVTDAPLDDKAQCERPDVGENRVIVDDSGQKTFPNGSTLTFKCATGYRPVDLSAPKIMTCVGTQWTKLELNCTKKSCGALPDFPNGKFTYPDGILFGATAIAQCNTGFSLVGENTRNCRENGWDGRDPVCEAVKCEPPPSIQNGTFDPLDDFYNYGQAVTYSCIRDYNLIGESTIVCSANGTFHPPPPRCLLVECEAPNIKNAVRVEGKPPPYRYKNFVRYQCNKGYTMNGSGYLVCEENGWNPPPPECITQCERPDVGENRVIVDDSEQKTFPNGSTLTFKCTTGYQPVDSSAPKIITCVGTEWTKLELNCTKKSCGALPDFPNGTYTYPDGMLFGATAVAQCNTGFSLLGEKNRNCRDSGWDGRDPVCEVSRINLSTAPPSDSPCLKPCGIIIAVVVFLLLSF